MCSILSVIDLRPGSDLSALRPLALSLSSRQRHRGPDWSGVYQHRHALLVHERLAIVDPAGGDTVLPVHTRIAMTMAAAKRLHGVLDSILNTPKSGDVPAAAQAQLPKIQQ